MSSSIGRLDAVLAQLRQHTVDVGDRRVLAGVHYPSDNLGSWIIALLLAPRVGGGSTSGRSFLWEAISKQSTVYRAISASVETDAGKAYADAFGLLNWLGAYADHDIDAALAHVGG